MVTPNLLNPRKLAANVRHPLREVFHTSHKQYPIEMKEGVEYHIVEHRRFSKLETVDVVSSDTFAKGLVHGLSNCLIQAFTMDTINIFPNLLD